MKPQFNISCYQEICFTGYNTYVYVRAYEAAIFKPSQYTKANKLYCQIIIWNLQLYGYVHC